MKEALVVIPARHASSRFPGKPLVNILGVPMILRVARRAAEVVGREQVVVATEDARIARVVEDAGFEAEMTSAGALTGTDRVAETSRARSAEIYVNVQGDEPMLEPSTIVRVIDEKRRNRDYVINAMCRLGYDEDADNVNIPKVVVNERNDMVYMSRRALPGFKDSRNAPTEFWKQVCAYAFTKEELSAYASFGRKSALEGHEDIEILRFLELGIPVRMVAVDGGTLAVDVPGDVALVEAAMQRRAVQ